MGNKRFVKWILKTEVIEKECIHLKYKILPQSKCLFNVYITLRVYRTKVKRDNNCKM